MPRMPPKPSTAYDTLPLTLSIITRSMEPIFWASGPYTAVPSTLSLPIRLLVSLSSIAMRALTRLKECQPGGVSMVPKAIGDCAALARSVMNDVKRQPADFVPLFIGDEHGIVLVLQLRQPLEQAPGDHVGGIHRLD